jgi:hypothetical protein
MSKVEVRKEDSEKVRVFSKREGDVICPDGSIMKFQQVTLVSKETKDWLFTSFPSLMLKVD